MKTLQLKAVKRAEFGKKAAKAFRREGLVPCMIYGGGEEIAFTVDAKEVKPLIYTPNSYIVELDIDGKIEKDFPATEKLMRAKPVWKVLPGWKCDIRGIRNYEELPENCRKYIEFVEEQIGYPITMVSNGPSRDDIIYRKSPLSK